MMSICYLIRSKVCRVVFSSRALRAFRLRQHSLTLDDIARSLACKESGLSENGVQGAPPLPWAERRPEGDRYASPEPEMRPGSPYVAEHAQWERAEEDEVSPLRPPRPSTAVPWRDGDAHGQERARPQSALA